MVVNLKRVSRRKKLSSFGEKLFYGLLGLASLAAALGPAVAQGSSNPPQNNVSSVPFKTFKVKSWPRLVSFVQAEVAATAAEEQEAADPALQAPANDQASLVSLVLAQQQGPLAFGQNALKSVKAYFGEHHDFLSNDIADLGPLYKKVAQKLATAQEEVGPRLGNNLLSQYGGLVPLHLLADQHQLSYTWTLPFDFGILIAVHRSFAPAFDSDGYIVNDEFKLTIHAQYLLDGLNEKGIIEIDASTLAAYAGVSFERTYNFSYAVDSLEEAIFGYLDRLFLPFIYLGKSKILEIANNEILTREDRLTATAAAAASAQVYASLTATAASLLEHQQLSKITIEGVGEDDQLVQLSRGMEQFRVEVTKQKTSNWGLSASMQVDLINLLRLTLVAVDYTHELTQSKSLALRFGENDLPYLSSKAVGQELQKLFIDYQYESALLKEFLISWQEKTKTSHDLTYWLSLLGGGHKSSTEEIFIFKEQEGRKFFRHEGVSASYIQNPVSGLMTALVKAVLKLNTRPANLATSKKTINIEYESSFNRIAAHASYDLSPQRQPASEIYLMDEDQLTSKRFYTILRDDFYAYQTSAKLAQQVKTFGVNLLNTYVGDHELGLEPYIEDIQANRLVGPLEFKGEIKLYEDGVLYLLSHDERFIKENIKEICQAYPRTNKVAMGKALERQHAWGPRKTCQVVLTNRYQDFAQAWAKAQKISGKQGLEVVPLRELQAWLAMLHVYIKDYNFYPELFGEENLFVQVRLSGHRPAAGNATTVILSSGHYAGEGIVADFAESPSDVLPLHSLALEEDAAELFKEELINEESAENTVSLDED